MAAQTIHEGRNIKRFREMLGIKQESLAGSMGNDWTQKKISQLEDKIKIEPAILEEVSAVLKIPVEAFQNFDEEQAVNIISSTFNDNAIANGKFTDCTFNPLDKVVELFERLLASEREKMELMRGILDRMK